MSKFDHHKIMPRYSAFALLMTLVAIAVVGKMLYIMTAKHDYWMAVADRVKKDSVDIKPTRGNILSCDGKLMASSLPEFKVFMDFQALHDAENDSLWEAKIDSISMGLNRIFPEMSAKAFRTHLEEGKKQRKRHWPIWPKRIDYNTFTEIRDLPVFNLSAYRSGFHFEENNARKRSYGSLASRTIGAMYGAKDARSEEHTSELQSRQYLVCCLLLEEQNPTQIDRD